MFCLFNCMLPPCGSFSFLFKKYANVLIGLPRIIRVYLFHPWCFGPSVICGNCNGFRSRIFAWMGLFVFDLGFPKWDSRASWSYVPLTLYAGHIRFLFIWAQLHCPTCAVEHHSTATCLSERVRSGLSLWESQVVGSSRTLMMLFIHELFLNDLHISLRVKFLWLGALLQAEAGLIRMISHTYFIFLIN